MWLPSFLFNNTRNNFVATFHDDVSSGSIQLNHNARYTLSTLDELKNSKHYKGKYA